MQLHSVHSHQVPAATDIPTTDRAAEKQSSAAPQPQPVSEPDVLFSYMMENTNSTTTNTVDSEMGSYLASPCSSLEPLLFWSNKAYQDSLPILYKLHLKHHCIPATSANVERVFSAAGFIASARRNILGDKTLELLVIAKCNRDKLINIAI